jgi:hypothetical protein
MDGLVMVEELEVQRPEPQEYCKEQDQDKGSFEREDVPEFARERGGLLHVTPDYIWYAVFAKKKVGVGKKPFTPAGVGASQRFFMKR